MLMKYEEVLATCALRNWNSIALSEKAGGGRTQTDAEVNLPAPSFTHPAGGRQMARELRDNTNTNTWHSPTKQLASPPPRVQPAWPSACRCLGRISAAGATPARARGPASPCPGAR